MYEPYPKTNQKIGLDMGLTYFMVTDNGVMYPNPKYLNHSLRKIRRLQRRLSRKSKDSQNRKRAKILVANAYEKLKNQRQDFLQKLSTELVRSYDVIATEHLDVLQMLASKKHRLNRHIQDASWSEFFRMLQYKCRRYEKTFVQVDTYFPSSQLCSACGFQNIALKDLSIRSWICPKCGSKHHRDVNAAKNILTEGLRQLS